MRRWTAPKPRFDYLDESADAAAKEVAVKALPKGVPGHYRAELDVKHAAGSGAAVNPASPEAARDPASGAVFGGKQFWFDGKKPIEQFEPPESVPLQERIYEAVQQIIIRIRANPLVSAGLATTAIALCVTTMYFSNRRHIPEYDLDKMSAKDRISVVNAMAN